METEFIAFPKMGRLSREVIVTEKIDGTNGQIHIERYSVDGRAHEAPEVLATKDQGDGTLLAIRAGSRTRWLTRQTDNFGFAKWVQENADDLFGLGEGRHFGEWWGHGIQRGYGLKEKRFSLFNTGRWIDTHTNYGGTPIAPQEFAPACCHVVPIIYRGDFETALIRQALSMLKEQGSAAAPGFMKPEGIVIFHTATNVGFKKTIEDDEKGKQK